MLFYFIQYLTWHVCNFFNRHFFHLRVKGHGHVDELQEGGVIFIANHSSKWDSFFIGSNLPLAYFRKMRGLRYMAFPRYTNNKWYGACIRLIGAYPVYSRGGDYEKSLKGTIKLLRSNYSLVMFPTGKRSGELDPSEARPGIAYLAKELDPVIVPVYIENSHCVSFLDFIFCRRHVKVTFGRPFHWTEAAGESDDLRTRANKIMRRVVELAK